MNIRKHDVLDLTIEKMAYGGQGVARVEGFVVFVRGAIPGDRLKAQVFKKKKGFAEARIIEINNPSSDRRMAPCPYSGHCGGCQWQHVHYERQLAYKKEQVEEAIKHIGTLEGASVRHVIPSEKKFAYRNKMEFSFSDRRWFLPDELDNREIEGGGALGLHVPGTYNKIIDIEACLLQQEKGNEILRCVKEYARNGGIPIYSQKTHKGFWRFLVVRHSTAFGHWMVNLVTGEESPEVLRPLADVLVRKNPQIKSIVNNINKRKASIAVGETEHTIAGNTSIKDMIGPFTFNISANSFFQTNSLGARRLYQTVADYGEFRGSETILDLYSGTGTIPVFLASKVHAITGIEISESAVEDAWKNCRENGIDNCQFICGDIREKLPAITRRPDVLIIDPPRAGMHKDVLAQVLALSPEKVIYVSCNPATLARDMGWMNGDYETIEVQPVDMFPHTYHIEVVAKLHRRKRHQRKANEHLTF